MHSRKTKRICRIIIEIHHDNRNLFFNNSKLNCSHLKTWPLCVSACIFVLGHICATHKHPNAIDQISFMQILIFHFLAIKSWHRHANFYYFHWLLICLCLSGTMRTSRIAHVDSSHHWAHCNVRPISKLIINYSNENAL